MQWFYNLKIKWKLILGFGVIALFSLLMGVLSLYALHDIHSQMGSALELTRKMGISTDPRSAGRLAEMNAAGDATYGFFRNIIIGLMAVTFLFGGYIAWFVGKTITISIRILLDVANRLGSGTLPRTSGREVQTR